MPLAIAREIPPNDLFAAHLRGFGPLGILAIVVILAGNLIVIPLSAILILVWVALSRTPWREIGYVRPRSWINTVLLGILFGLALKFLLKALIMPLLGADPVNQAYHYLAGNRAALPDMLFLIVVGAGFGEETLFRGYTFERLGKLLGFGFGASLTIVLLSSLWFGVVHYPVQGLAGAQQATIVGLLFGTIFALTRQIWMLMFAHVAFDIAALAIIYWDVESDVAHLIFK